MGLCRQRTGVHVSGLANAWQYFFLNALASLKADGLAALIVPFEWVSRPSAKTLRAYIREQQWNVYVYRLRDPGFARVLTTASITVVDKAARDGKWEFHDETEGWPRSTDGIAIGIECRSTGLLASDGPSGGRFHGQNAGLARGSRAP